MQKMTIELTETETNLILQALSSQPYKDVFQMIAKLQSEFIAQNPPERNLAEQNPGTAGPVQPDHRLWYWGIRRLFWPRHRYLFAAGLFGCLWVRPYHRQRQHQGHQPYHQCFFLSYLCPKRYRVVCGGPACRGVQHGWRLGGVGPCPNQRRQGHPPGLLHRVNPAAVQNHLRLCGITKKIPHPVTDGGLLFCKNCGAGEWFAPRPRCKFLQMQNSVNQKLQTSLSEAFGFL